MESNYPAKHGVKWGLMISVIYCAFLFLRYKLGQSNALVFAGLAFVGFILIIVLLLVCGFNLRKKMGGFVETKEVFKALFYAVLIFEFAYAVFNFIYIKYINPDFFLNLRDSMEKLLIETKQPQEKIDEMLSGIDVEASKKMTFFDVLKSYLFWVALNGAIAFFIALIVKRKPQPNQLHPNNDSLDLKS